MTPRRMQSANSAIHAIRVRLMESIAGLGMGAMVLVFVGRVWLALRNDPAEMQRVFEHGWGWAGLQFLGLFLLLWIIWGAIFAALTPCVGYSTERESNAILVIVSSVVMVFVVGLAPKAIDGTALLLYLAFLNVVTHGIAAVMEAVGLGIRARDDGEGGWIRNGWMGVKRLAFFGITGYTLMMLVWWWTQDPLNEQPDHQILAAAERGNAGAQNQWAVRLDRKGDRAGAVVWLEKAVAKGHVGAMCNLSIAVKKTDPARTFALLTKAAESGSARATYMLGRCYRDGVGTSVDKYRAAELFRDAAFSQGGYPPAMNDLMVLIHSELPKGFRSELFEKLRDGEIRSLEDALEHFTPKLDGVESVWEMMGGLLDDDRDARKDAS